MIRPARPEDARKIAEIKIAAWKFAYSEILPPHILDIDVEEESGKWAARLHTTTNCFVSSDDRGVAGYATFGPSEVLKVPSEQQLYSLYIEPVAQRQGHGGKLVRHIAAEVQAKGHRQLIVCLFSQNHRAREFYEKLGAEFLCDATYRVDGIDYPDEVRVWRDLGKLIGKP